MYYASRIFLLVFATATSVLTLIAALDIGFLNTQQSSSYARYGSLTLFFFAATCSALQIQRLMLSPIAIGIIGFFLLGATVGIINNGPSREFFAHSYYALMPVIMICFSYMFIRQMINDEPLRRLLISAMKVIFLSGTIAVTIFVIGYSMESARYNATGTPLFYAASFLGFQKAGIWYVSASFVGTLFAAKRVSIIIFVVALLVIFYIYSRRKGFLYFLSILSTVLIALSLAIVLDAGAISRFDFMIDRLRTGDVDMATAGRVQEAVSAMEVILSDPLKMLFGAGFGATFIPWDIAGYESYVAHYTHFSPITYWLIGGIFFPLIMYGYLFFYGFQLLLLAGKPYFPEFFLGFVPLYWSLLVSSFSGGVILNESGVWFFLGCGIAIVRILSPRRKNFSAIGITLT